MTRSNPNTGQKRSSPEPDNSSLHGKSIKTGQDGSSSKSKNIYVVEQKTPNKKRKPTPVVSGSTHSEQQDSNSCSSTPSVNRSGHVHGHTNFGSTEKEVVAERKKEARLAASRTVETDKIADVVIPRSLEVAQMAKQIAIAVSGSLEKHIQDKILNSGSNPDQTPFLYLTNHVANSLDEKRMYPAIESLLAFVSVAIKKAHEQITEATDTSFSQPLPRSLATPNQFDRKPAGADSNHRIDMALNTKHEPSAIVDENSKQDSQRPDYSDMLAVLEAKSSVDKQDDAYAQLIEYSRNIYPHQHNRRFVWGLTVCKNALRICILQNDALIASPPIDLKSTEGRLALVKWCTNVSFCDEDQLGYDSTIYFNDAKRRWEIKVFDDASAEKDTFKVFEILTCMRVAERVFGRHTRCFRCREIDDNDNSSTLSEDLSRLTLEEICELGNVLVKDAWAHTDRDTEDGSSRDEIALLNDINKALGDKTELNGRFPTVLAAGVVRQQGSHGQLYLDTVDDVLAVAKQELPADKVHQRVHKRIAMTPIGKNLREVQCVDELIIAAADAMEVHSAISKGCQILHRDISSNNILIRRSNDTGRVNGILIDYDCALRIGNGNEPDRTCRPDMTGTLPYMSIGNLSQSSVARTVLDDWESIIYVLCWLGTFGVNYDDEDLHQVEEDAKRGTPPIYSWRTGTSINIAEAKRNDMNSQEYFQIRIVDRFIRKPEYTPLQLLVDELREKLFDNPNVSGLARGAMVAPNTSFGNKRKAEVNDNHWDSKCDKDERDRFVRRASCADLIANDLLEVMIQARNEAVSRLYKSNK
ncbi:hypothetical protein FB645_001902 [Coemansia sp. IMI 203386]|nr:hypothetical protein FB645_001902 [Coemansia sp. IMI 203386]